MRRSENVVISGPAGRIESIVDLPAAPLRGIALVCHPHPLFGGANSNKVAHALARSFNDLGYAVWRPNFRGVGKSDGEHDEGIGETADMQAVVAAAKARHGDLPLALGGFSFGAFVQTRLASELAAAGTPAERLVLVGTAAGFVEGTRGYDTAAVPADSIVIHGSADETVPLANVLKWAEPQNLPVIVIPGADHFFHHRLQIIRSIVTQSWRPAVNT